MQYVDRLLEYPDFNVRFVERFETPVEAPVRGVSYTFDVLGKQGRRFGRFTHTMSGYYDPVRVFKVHGEVFATEMFSTPVEHREAGGPLWERMGRDEIIVWDKATAKAHNPELLKVWTRNYRPFHEQP